MFWLHQYSLWWANMETSITGKQRRWIRLPPSLSSLLTYIILFQTARYLKTRALLLPARSSDPVPTVQCRISKNHKGLCLQLKLCHCLSLLALVPAQQGSKGMQKLYTKALYDVSPLPGWCLFSLSTRVHRDCVSIWTRHHEEQTWHFQFWMGIREWPVLLCT